MPLSTEWYTIAEDDPDVTLTANTANVESEIINYRCPQKSAVKVKKGVSRLYLYLATSGPTQITTGTIRIYKASVDKETHRTFVCLAKIEELDAGGTPEDKEKQYLLKKDVVLGPQEYLIITLNSASVAATAQTKLMLDVGKVIEYTT